MISFDENNMKFNYRVGAIIISADKKRVLLHTIKGYDFFLLPGGRVEWLEDSESAIKRELAEELGLEVKNCRLRQVLENFFKFRGINYHEISHNFVIELTDDQAVESKEIFCGLEGEKYIFQWFDVDKLDKVKIKPNILKDTIKNYNDSIKFEIFKEIKI